MATQTPKRTRAKFVSKQTIEQVVASLQELPEKTPDNHSLRQAVEQLRETIEAALAKGYSYEDLVPILAKQGIDIQPSTLKRYILTSNTRSTAKRSSSNPTKTKQVRKKPQPTTTAEDTSETAEVAAPAPASAKRGRAAAKAKPQPTATETTEAPLEPSKQSRSRRTATTSPAAAKSRTTSTRGRKATKG